MSNKFGVNSEVGKLRKVIVHRPDLDLKRLTPSNHDDLLFDDVLWVERAQWEHDQFVKVMREQGIGVFYHVDLLGEALACRRSHRRHFQSLLGIELGPVALPVISLRRQYPLPKLEIGFVP